VTELEHVRLVTAFLARTPPFTGLTHETRERLAAAIEERQVAVGDEVMVEEGAPAISLYIVRDGALELVRRGRVVDVLTSGKVFGHPSLLSGEPPEFTVRAREVTSLYVVPGEEALDLLSRPEGVAFVARTLRERLVRAVHAVYDEQASRAVPVSSLLERPALFCEPQLTIREAARRMSEEGVTYALIDTRAGLGIVTNTDLRDKVLAGDVSAEAQVGSIATTPVKTVRAETLAPEASIEMLASGVQHLPVVDARGRVQGVISTGTLMALDELTPFALQRQISRAGDEDDVVAAAALLPRVFLTLLDGHLDAIAVSRVLALQTDALTTRLIDLWTARHGPPPVAFAWLALGSVARGEPALSSDQDNALAYADTDDPEVSDYFARLTADVNAGLARCGFELDYSGVNAENPAWRLSQSQWLQAFRNCFTSPDHSHLIRASIVFDFRQVVGTLDIVTPLRYLMRKAGRRHGFLAAMSSTVTEVASPLVGFRRRLRGPIDVKKAGLLPIVNMARFQALANGVSVTGTLDRLAALETLQALDRELADSLRRAFTRVTHLRLLHQGEAVRAGRRPNDAVDTTELDPLTHAELQEALRLIDSAQQLVKSFPLGMRA